MAHHAILLWLAGAAKSEKDDERLTDMKSRAESMLALREKGIDAVFSLLDGLLPPLVASGASVHLAKLFCVARALTFCSVRLRLELQYVTLPDGAMACHAARHAYNPCHSPEVLCAMPSVWLPLTRTALRP